MILNNIIPSAQLTTRIAAMRTEHDLSAIVFLYSPNDSVSFAVIIEVDVSPLFFDCENQQITNKINVNLFYFKRMHVFDVILLVGKSSEHLPHPGPLFHVIARLAIFPTSVLQKNLVSTCFLFVF